MKKILALLLALTMVFALAACGNSASGSTGGKESSAVLYHAYSSQPYVTLDPRSENSNGIMVLHNVYETLTHYNDATGEVEALLAKDWSVNETGDVWVFNLRDDVTFHDGTPMTAANVVKSINKTIEMGMGAAYIWDAVESIEQTGEYQVTFTCSYPAPVDLIASAAYASYIISDAAVDQDTEWFNAGNDGGTGPYTIAQANGDTCVMTAYENYRGGWTDKQYKNVIIKEVPESNARRQLLETGEAQITAELSSTDNAALRAETDKVDVNTFPTYTNVVLMLNHESAPCSNTEFRKALAYAFPYQETVDSVLEGSGAVSNGLVAAGLWGHDDSLVDYSCDLDKAAECLAASGVTGDDLNITLTYTTGDDAYTSWAQLYQINLKKIGINLELKPMEWDAQWELAQANDPEARQDMFAFIWWPDYATPESWFASMVLSEEEICYNLGYIKDEHYDELITEAIEKTSTDRDLAIKNYAEVQQGIIDNADIISLYDIVDTFVTSKSISGVYENPAYPASIYYYNVTMN